MNITKFSDYTLRVLIFLAAAENKKSTAQVISSAYGVSFHHIAKAAQWLAREGYVHSERGKMGGIILSRALSDINIGDVLRKTQADTSLVECMKSDGGVCCISPACGLKVALAKAQAVFYAELDNYSLADITQQKTSLQNLLVLS